MAEIRPLHALRYDLDRTGGLQDVVAPPYDVIDAEQRAALDARSPYNVVAVDLPEGGDDRYERAAALFARLAQPRGSSAEPSRRCGRWSRTTRAPTAGAATRRGFFARVRIEDYGPGRIRPHERTHPGPKEDRLRLTRATRTNLSPIFSLYSDPAGTDWARWPRPASAWAQTTDDDGTVNRLGRVLDPAAIATVTRRSARRSC